MFKEKMNKITYKVNWKMWKCIYSPSDANEQLTWFTKHFCFNPELKIFNLRKTFLLTVIRNLNVHFFVHAACCTALYWHLHITIYWIVPFGKLDALHFYTPHINFWMLSDLSWGEIQIVAIQHGPQLWSKVFLSSCRSMFYLC